MFLHPNSLLDCVRSMTPAQKAELCQLLDPAVPNALENVVEVEIDTVLKRAVFGPDGPQGPPGPAGPGPFRDHKQREMFDNDHSGFMVIKGCEHVPEPMPAGLFPQADANTVARLLYKQMPGKNLVDNVKQVLATMPPNGVIPPADDDTLIMSVGKPQHLVHHARWTNARVRWFQFFGEDEVPMVRDVKNIAGDLDLVEALLYDKEHKNHDPVRCSCGCGYVVGCGSTKGIHNMEG